MEAIANAKDLKRGASLTFPYKRQEGILVRTDEGKLVAYVSACPHESGTIEWDGSISRLLCACHLALFNVDDGTLYRQSSAFNDIGDLTPIELKIDDNQDISAV
ncbi:MAG: Rieske (2Fe-2S) protein [Actinomycetes bacterium]